eukprot:gene16927-23195_t
MPRNAPSTRAMHPDAQRSTVLMQFLLIRKFGACIVSHGRLVVVSGQGQKWTVESFSEGTLVAIICEEGISANVGSPIAFVAETEADIPAAKAKAAALSAKTLGVNLSTVAGSGPGGRITASDVERSAAGGAPAAAAAAPAAAAPAPARAAPGPGPVAATTVSELKGSTKAFNGMQMAVNKNMIASLAVPEFRVSYQIETGKLDAMYKKLKPHGVTMTALIAKACGVALASHPIMHAAVTPDGNGIQYNEHVNIAMAVAMPDGGLITPVLQDADKTDIYQLSRNWADLVKRARTKQLSPAEYTTGNFTISNLGMFGVEAFDAILPPGTAAIIAIRRPTKAQNSVQRAAVAAAAAEFLRGDPTGGYVSPPEKVAGVWEDQLRQGYSVDGAAAAAAKFLRTPCARAGYGNPDSAPDPERSEGVQASVVFRQALHDTHKGPCTFSNPDRTRYSFEMAGAFNERDCGLITCQAKGAWATPELTQLALVFVKEHLGPALINPTDPEMDPGMDPETAKRETLGKIRL